jgi:putative endonuclease
LPSKTPQGDPRPLAPKRERSFARSGPGFVYVIASRHRGVVRTYVGWTTDLEQRLAQHNKGTGARSTRGRKWRLLYAERFDDRRKAMSREWHLKRDRRMRSQLRQVF